MSNPIIASTTDKEELPWELEKVTEKYKLLLKPYKKCFLFTEQNRVMVYEGMTVSKDEVHLIFKYNMDPDALSRTANTFTVNKTDAASMEQLGRELNAQYMRIREARLKFIELRQQFLNMEVDMILAHNGFTL